MLPDPKFKAAALCSDSATWGDYHGVFAEPHPQISSLFQLDFCTERTQKLFEQGKAVEVRTADRVLHYLYQGAVGGRKKKRNKSERSSL